MNSEMTARSGSGGACNPPGGVAAVSRLTRRELERLAARFYGRCPARFEELVLQFWAEREAS